VSTTDEVPVVGARQPCPCGSGKRYKNCHGAAARRQTTRRRHVPRPFEGLPGETDWVAMREIVASATAPTTLTGDHAGRDVLVVTLLPGATAALHRENGQVLVALQTTTATGDPSADIAQALVAALEADPGTPIPTVDVDPEGTRLQDLVDPGSSFEVTVHDGFDFWVAEDEEPSADVAAMLESAAEVSVPAVRLTSVESAYWCRLGERDQLRWILPHAEEPLLDALARLRAAGEDGVGEGTRLLGTFRASGLLVPVWDLVPGTTADDVEDPAHDFGTRLETALATTTPLSGEERRARGGLANRQVTIR
jgi:hypothetical protein